MDTTHNGIEFKLIEVPGARVVVHLFPEEKHTAEMVIAAKQWCYYNLPVKDIKVLRPHLTVKKPSQ